MGIPVGIPMGMGTDSHMFFNVYETPLSVGACFVILSSD